MSIFNIVVCSLAIHIMFSSRLSGCYLYRFDITWCLTFLPIGVVRDLVGILDIHKAALGPHSLWDGNLC